MHQTTMKTKGRMQNKVDMQKQSTQRVCKTKWMSSEVTVRASSGILAIYDALKQLSENKIDALCVFFTATFENKNLNMVSFQIGLCSAQV